MLCLAIAPAANAQSFGPPTTYSIGRNGYPYYVAVGDLNNDGIQDLVGCNSSQYGIDNAKIAVLLGQASGGYRPAVFYSTGAPNFARGLALGDVTGDGLLDAVVGVTTGMQVFPGLSDGTFGTPKSYAGNGNLGGNSVLLNDLNKDGKLDVVLSSTVGGFAFIYLRQATDFAAPVTYQASNGFGDAEDMALGDITGDGKDDLVVANFTGYTVTVLPGKGDGTFKQYISYPAGSIATQKNDPISVALADLNKDGQLDVVTANYSTNTVGVLLGKAGGTLGTMTTYPSGGTLPLCARLGDLNGDGRLDVAINNESGGLGVLLGKSDGTFGSTTTFATPYYSQQVVLRDLNKDGRLDAVTADYGTGTLTVLLNTGTYVALATTPALTAAHVSLYPNPAHDNLTLELPGSARIATVKVIDMRGSLMSAPYLGNGKLDVLGLAAGFYTVTASDGTTEYHQKFVKE